MCLAVGDVIFGTAELSFQLYHIGFGHLSLLHHFHSSVILALCRLEEFLVHVHSLLGVHNLHVELSYLLLYGEFALLGGELGGIVLEFLVLHVLQVFASVPNGPPGIESIAALVCHLVAGVGYLPVLYDVGSSLKGSVSHALGGAETKAGEEGTLVLPQSHVSLFLADAVFLNLDIVLQGMFYALFQIPGGLCVCRAPQGEGEGAQGPHSFAHCVCFLHMENFFVVVVTAKATYGLISLQIYFFL